MFCSAVGSGVGCPVGKLDGSGIEGAGVGCALGIGVEGAGVGVADG